MSEGRDLVTPDQAVQDWLLRMGELSTAKSAGEVPDLARLTRPPFPPVLSSMEIVKRREAPSRERPRNNAKRRPCMRT